VCSSDLEHRIDENDFIELIENDRDDLFRETPENDFEWMEKFMDEKKFSNVGSVIGRSNERDFIDFIDSEAWSKDEKLAVLKAGFKSNRIQG